MWLIVHAIPLPLVVVPHYSVLLTFTYPSRITPDSSSFMKLSLLPFLSPSCIFLQDPNIPHFGIYTKILFM